MDANVLKSSLEAKLNESTVKTCIFCNIKPYFETEGNMTILCCPNCKRPARGFISRGCIKSYSDLDLGFHKLLVSWNERN